MLARDVECWDLSKKINMSLCFAVYLRLHRMEVISTKMMQKTKR